MCCGWSVVLWGGLLGRYGAGDRVHDVVDALVGFDVVVVLAKIH